jgi:hypothetical protein
MTILVFLVFEKLSWNLVNKSVRKCFNGTWYIGTVQSYKLQRQWFAVTSSDGMEEYSPPHLALICYSELHPSAFFLAFDLVVLVMVTPTFWLFLFSIFVSPWCRFIWILYCVLSLNRQLIRLLRHNLQYHDIVVLFSIRFVLWLESLSITKTDHLECSTVDLALNFGTQGPGFESGFFHKACYIPLHGC